MITGRDLFRFCACCPSPCRSAIPATDLAQSQTATPSSLAMIALAVMDGQLHFDQATRDLLSRISQARLCAKACPYGYDVASAITVFTAARNDNNASSDLKT